MSHVEIIFYKDDSGSAPVLDWIRDLQKKEKAKVLDRIFLLSERGYVLRRPHADSVAGSDLYELRMRFNKVRARIFYFFYQGKAAILCHVMSRKQTDKIPQSEIERSFRKREKFMSNPEKHSYKKVILS